MTRSTAPYGTWRSPIATDDLLKGALGLAFPSIVDGSIYWMEARPAEAGRTVIVRRDRSATLSDCLPPPFSARSRVHEYGGICYAVGGGQLYFVNFSDQRIYAQDLSDPDATPVAVTAADGRRYADLTIDRDRKRLLAVAEEDQEGGEPRNFIAAVSLEEAAGEASAIELVTGSDFFATPRLSPDGQSLVWLSWDHPAMPWDGTTLWRADLDDAGLPGDASALAGSETESIFQPEFTHDGSLIAISDRSGWWNLERIAPGKRRELLPHAADFGLPLWQFGMRTYTECHDGRLACTWQAPEGDQLGLLDPDSGRIEERQVPWTQLGSIVSDDHDLVFIGAGPDRFAELVRFEVDSGRFEIIRRSSEIDLTTADIAVPEALHYLTGSGSTGSSHTGSSEDSGDGDEDETAHAYYYPPTHRSSDGLPNEKPPLLVMSHGGPTAATAPVLNLKVQFWTSRGFAVLDVNYRGSTGYGRAYRDKLKGGWGVVDVEDCVAGAKFLVERGDVDPERLAIRGSSAGGFTTLAALTFHDLFSAGASLYGIGDLEALAQDTHKFESRYLDSLVGPYPEAMDVYRARSPIHHVDQLACPVIFLQGLEDRIVPPAQAEAMVAALEAKGLPVAYVAFEGEQHGFRQAANIRRALEAELDFYGRVFGFTPADAIDPVPIRNL